MTENTADAAVAVDTVAEESGPKLANADLTFQVAQFLYYEAELLDDGQFADWLEIFDEDLTYFAPLRTNRLRRQAALSISGPDEAAYFDETKESLAWRIRRYDSGMAWAEDPPSRTRHLVSNVTVRHLGPNENGEEELRVRSAFIVYRNRLQTEVDIYSGGRTDILRVKADGSLKVANREILFDANVLQAKNLSTFF